MLRSLGLLSVLLLICFYVCITHAYLTSMITEFIVPHIKCKSGDFSEHNNDRPMTLASIVSKV